MVGSILGVLLFNITTDNLEDSENANVYTPDTNRSPNAVEEPEIELDVGYQKNAPIIQRHRTIREFLTPMTPN